LPVEEIRKDSDTGRITDHILLKGDEYRVTEDQKTEAKELIERNFEPKKAVCEEEEEPQSPRRTET